MGAYSPAPVVTPEIHAKILREVIRPVVSGMKAEGTPYTGFLYAGLMIAPDGKQGAGIQLPHGRPGDPADHDAAQVRSGRPGGSRRGRPPRPGRGGMGPALCALGIVMAAAGYPDTSAQGRCHHRPDGGDAKPGEDFHVFHAGTAIQDDQVVTAGGRVLCVTALGDTVKIAQARAYEVAEGIDFAGRQMRRDIGWRAIQRKKK
jgi:phosphoribosylamine--glycine ligase